MAKAKLTNTVDIKSKRMFTDALTISTVTGVSKPTPLNWFKSGKIPGVKIGNVVMFPIAEVAVILGVSSEALAPEKKDTPEKKGGGK
jgi:hypothetical protein